MIQQEPKEKGDGQEENSSYQQVIDSHKNLLDLIHELNEKVEKVIEKHESQFLLAYQSHMRKIDLELAEIRRKADLNEKEMKNENKLMILEKQLILFRDESLKLYDRLEQKTHEAQIYKLKSIDLEKTCYITQKQIREALKKKRFFELRLLDAERKIQTLQNEIAQKNQMLEKFSAFTSEANTKAVTLKKLSLRQKPERRSTLMNKSALQTKKPSAKNIYDSELKCWFIECIKTVKKDVANRKNSGYQFDLDEISSIQEFKMVDKLKLLEKFMEDEKLLTWMYQKIFPSRTDHIKQYLSLTKIDDSHSSQKGIQSELLEHIETDQPTVKSQIQVVLPKMKMPKSQVRNKVSVRQGKLSLCNP